MVSVVLKMPEALLTFPLHSLMKQKDWPNLSHGGIHMLYCMAAKERKENHNKTMLLESFLFLCGQKITPHQC